MEVVSSDCKLRRCCICIPVKFGVYIIGFFVMLSLLEGLFTPLVPVQFFQDLVDYADKNMQVYFYIKTGLELMLTMTFIQLMARDTYQTRDILFRAYTLYTVIVTVLSLFMAFFPGEGSRKLDANAISKYCQELSETNLFYFDSVDECLTKSSLNLRRNELIFINISFIVQMHFIHVIWSHLQNSSLPRSQGGCVPDLRTQNIQM